MIPARRRSAAPGTLLILACWLTGAGAPAPCLAGGNELAAVDPWFDAWELVSAEVYGLDAITPVDFIFFDNHEVYSTSLVTAGNGETVTGPAMLGYRPVWRRASHNGSIRLPDGESVPVGLMSFSAPPHEPGAQAFFVMPLPSFWQQAGVDSDELGLERLLVGVFLHEFSHSQQMRGFGAQITALERRLPFGNELHDDIVQQHFEDDADYTARFRTEITAFYAASQENDAAEKIRLTRDVLSRYRARQDDYFRDDDAVFAELEDFFLSMEGAGQFTMYAWLVHPRGGAAAAEAAIAGIRRGGRWWTQDLGLAMFLLLDDFSPPAEWGPAMFGPSPGNIVDLLEAATHAYPAGPTAAH